MTSGEQSQLELPDLWEEDIWDELLAYVEEGCVIPIIGRDLIQIEVDGQQMLLEQYVAQQLVSKFKLSDVSNSGEASFSLNDVVCRLLTSRRREAIYVAIRDVMQQTQFATPLPLRQLAEIHHFRLFVSTTFDSLLEQALNEVRYGGIERTTAIAYAPSKVRDIDGGNSRSETTVYYLLGKLSAAANFVICDEDLLEFVSALQSDTRRPERLFDELNANHSFFLGEGYPDWLARFFLRATKQHRLFDRRDYLEILADNRTARDRSLIFFLQHFSSRTRVFGDGAINFVGELWRRWRARNPAVVQDAEAAFIPPPKEMPAASVFISYAREDLTAVKQLKSGLEQAGITVWFDYDRLNSGDAFESKIREYIRSCKLFIPVLSGNTESRHEGFFRREWRFAEDRALNIDPGIPFIVPVVVDETKQLRRVPESFMKLHLTWLKQGQVTEDFCQNMRRLCAQVG